jgi:uncharacterized protein YndB with AHSA1/START domain
MHCPNKRALLIAGLSLMGVGPAFAQTTGTNGDFQMTVSTTASKAAVYALWANPATWSRWDPQISSVTFSGPVQVGARGRLRGTGGPESPFQITAVEPGVRFSYVVTAPLTRIEFTRNFETGETTRFTHRVRFTGAGGGTLSGILGKRFREGLPGTMARLKAQAEAAS